MQSNRVTPVTEPSHASTQLERNTFGESRLVVVPWKLPPQWGATEGCRIIYIASPAPACCRSPWAVQYFAAPCIDLLRIRGSCNSETSCKTVYECCISNPTPSMSVATSVPFRCAPSVERADRDDVRTSPSYDPICVERSSGSSQATCAGKVRLGVRWW